MHVLVAPASFKGSLSPRDAALAIAHAITTLDHSITTDICPIADGGESTAAILAAATGATPQSTPVPGPLDDTPIDATWFRLENLADAPRLADALDIEDPQGPAAIFDSAQIVGLPHIPEDRRDPAKISTRGIGRLIHVTRSQGCATTIIGLGGTASIDAGVGAAAELGWRFDSQKHAISNPVGADICKILQTRAPASTIDRAPSTPGAHAPRVVALTDVTNPLTGPTGAARTFGPQKGASPQQIDALDDALAHLASLVDRADPSAPAMGAAGGLAWGLAAFLGASLRPGIDAVLHTLDAHNRLARADLAITGEGALDAQTRDGKALAGLAHAAAQTGTPVIAIAGTADPGAASSLSLAALHTLVAPGVSPADARTNAAALLTERAAHALTAWIASQRH